MLGTNKLTLQPQKNPAITSMTPATILCRKTPAAAVSKNPGLWLLRTKRCQ
jgi:hypothetical protein